jgi:hypothetical protein
MAEFVHTFRQGKMNQDLDERLIPEGEYRDALNLEVSSSEGSDRGAMQNIIGNLAINNQGYNPSTLVATQWAANEYITALTNATCIGAISDTLNDNVYWLITSDEADVIAKLDQSENVVSPILVDTQNILKFSTNFLVTGINILDGVLFWTDNNTEPKSLDIGKFLNSTTDFVTHSQIYGRDFIESDVTVILKSPLTAPGFTALASKRGGQGTGIDPVSVIYNVANEVNFTYLPDPASPAVYKSMPTFAAAQSAEAGEFPPGIDGIVFITTSGSPNWLNGDVINLKAKKVSEYQEAYAYQVVLLITGGGGTNNIQAQIQSISSDILRFYTETGGDDPLVWEALLEEGDSMFENQFPRFAYRWKYSNNQYSSFSPFTSVVFVGGKFEYLSSDGYNQGMINNIRLLELNNIDWGGDDVESIEVLYKDSISPAVYTVDTLESRSITTLDISSEIIGALVESNQILRPWDNIPLKAKSQEITGNRLLYANYTQNYAVDSNISLSINEAPSEVDEVRFPNQSIKSIRTYQAGVLFKDLYGRETPVFTNSTASVIIPRDSAKFANALELTSNELPPNWATHFKYFIKETSNEYYNLALDRYYIAEDGNVWLSFPSSERNKVDEETYLYLKKQHDTDVSVDIPARYKILSIASEAPDFIATTTLGIAQSNCTLLNASRPGVDVIQFRFNGPTAEANPAFNGGLQATNTLVITAGGTSTGEYKIASGGPTGTGNEYSVTLTEPLGLDASFLDQLESGDNITITINEITVEQLPEFEGRFFAKVNRNAAFDTNIIDTFSDAEDRYGIIAQLDVPANIAIPAPPTSGGGSGSSGPGFGDTNARGGYEGQDKMSPPIANQDWFGVGWSNYPGGNDSPISSGALTTPVIDEYMPQAGTNVRFLNADGVESEVYVIGATQTNYDRRGVEDVFGFGQRTIGSNARKSVRCTLDRNFESGFGNAVTVQIVQKIITPGNKILSSSNPAIFETEPKEAVDIDIYYQATNAIPVAQYGTAIILDWFNCYSYGNGVESNRIRDDYNQPYIDKNPIASAPLDDPYAPEVKSTGLIFSQIYNSNSGINGLNQFIQALPITKDLNPAYGSIQKLHSRDTNVVAMCEDKILRILANKDALFNADGSANVTSNSNVLGQAVPFAGEFGISKNPESFSQFGYRVYFTDRARGSVLRLSNDGIEEISRYGMEDFFSDNLIKNKDIFGSYDIGTGEYNVTLNYLTPEWQEKLSISQFDRTNETDPSCAPEITKNPTLKTTISFAEGVNGWTSRKSFIPEFGLYLNNSYYTFRSGLIWDHKANSIYNNFYGLQYDSSVDLVTNDSPNTVKGYKTLNYTGSDALEYQYQLNSTGIKNYSIAEVSANQLVPNTFSTTSGWYANSVYTDLQEGQVKEFITKEGKHFNYIKGLQTYFDTTCDTNVNSQEFSVQGIGRADVTGDTEITAWDVNICIDASCYNEVQPPVVVNQFYEGLEDTIMNIQLTGPATCEDGSAVVYSLASDATTGGTLDSVSSTGAFQFTPNLNYFGGSGSFNVNACCGGVCSMFTVTLEILPVAEDPYFVSSHPSIALQPEECWEYNPIILADPDHVATDLFIQTPVPNLPSWMNQPQPLNDGTGNWYIPSSCLPAGASASTINFTMTVEDPDGNTGTQEVGGNTLVEAIVALEFLVTTRNAQTARSYTNPNTGVVTAMAPITSSMHGCTLGTYLITANGVGIGRAYVGNVQISAPSAFDSFSVNQVGDPNSSTGDLMQDVVTGATYNIPSAIAQGVTDTRLFNPIQNTWAGWNFPQKYITSSDNFTSNQAGTIFVNFDRYNLLTIDNATAQNIIANSPDPDNPSYITFALVADTYAINSQNITHGDGVAMQIFQSEVEVYSAIQPNNSALTIDVLTGNIIP